MILFSLTGKYCCLLWGACFYSLMDQARASLQSIAARQLKKGEEVFLEGDIPDDTMYFILSGQIGLYRGEGASERQINEIGPGSFFGEMALVNHRPRLATARVDSDIARLALINKATLLKMAGSSPQFLLKLLRYTVSRLLSAEDKLQRVREDLQAEKEKKGIY